MESILRDRGSRESREEAGETVLAGNADLKSRILVQEWGRNLQAGSKSMSKVQLLMFRGCYLQGKMGFTYHQVPRGGGAVLGGNMA